MLRTFALKVSEAPDQNPSLLMLRARSIYSLTASSLSSSLSRGLFRVSVAWALNFSSRVKLHVESNTVSPCPLLGKKEATQTCCITALQHSQRAWTVIGRLVSLLQIGAKIHSEKPIKRVNEETDIQLNYSHCQGFYTVQNLVGDPKKMSSHMCWC